MRLLIDDEDLTPRLMPAIDRITEGCFVTSARSFPNAFGYTWYVVELGLLPEDVLPDFPAGSRGPAIGESHIECFLYEGGKVFSAFRCYDVADWIYLFVYDRLYDKAYEFITRREDPFSVASRSALVANLVSLRASHEESRVSDFFSFEEVLPGLKDFVVGQFSVWDSLPPGLRDANGDLPEWADRYLEGPTRAEMRARRLVLGELTGTPRRKASLDC